MGLRAGDRAPRAIRFTIATGSVNGTLVASVRLRVLNPVTSVQQTWGPLVPTSTTTTSVVCTYVLASDGSSVPNAGQYPVAAWLYDSGGALLDVTEQGVLPIGPGLALSPPPP